MDRNDYENDRNKDIKLGRWAGQVYTFLLPGGEFCNPSSMAGGQVGKYTGGQVDR